MTLLHQTVLRGITLTDFHRKRHGGGGQTFYFDFQYKEKRYTLEHTFYYGYGKTEHTFTFRKPSFFSPKPFDLSKEELIRLSSALMKKEKITSQE